MLHVAHLSAGYGQATVLHDVSFTVATATIHAVVGPNGAGKTTLLHTLAGLVPARSGTIHHDGHALHGQPAYRVARTGVALVPQGRRVFASLTVAEHLDLTQHGGGYWTPQRLVTQMPALQPLLGRRARHLSGGEQQMLATSRALATNPALLLLDEPTEGLTPALADTMRRLIGQLAAHGTTIVLTAPAPEPLAATMTVLDHGHAAALAPTESVIQR